MGYIFIYLPRFITNVANDEYLTIYNIYFTHAILPTLFEIYASINSNMLARLLYCI